MSPAMPSQMKALRASPDGIVGNVGGAGDESRGGFWGSSIGHEGRTPEMVPERRQNERRAGWRCSRRGPRKPRHATRSGSTFRCHRARRSRIRRARPRPRAAPVRPAP
jgi:hypothetical protein